MTYMSTTPLWDETARIEGYDPHDPPFPTYPRVGPPPTAGDIDSHVHDLLYARKLDVPDPPTETLPDLADLTCDRCGTAKDVDVMTSAQGDPFGLCGDCQQKD